jgi:hypothetical protein
LDLHAERTVEPVAHTNPCGDIDDDGLAVGDQEAGRRGFEMGQFAEETAFEKCARCA